MSRLSRWGFEVGTLGDRWYWGKKFPRLRLQVSVTVYRHVYHSGSTDRWVIQPGLVYDRKKVGSGERAYQLHGGRASRSASGEWCHRD